MGDERDNTGDADEPNEFAEDTGEDTGEHVRTEDDAEQHDAHSHDAVSDEARDVAQDVERRDE